MNKHGIWIGKVRDKNAKMVKRMWVLKDGELKEVVNEKSL